MRLCTIAEDMAVDTLAKIKPWIWKVARHVAGYYNPGSKDLSITDDLFQVGMLEIIKAIKSGKIPPNANDNYYTTMARRAMMRGGKHEDGTKIGRMNQVAPLYKDNPRLKKAEYDVNDDSDWDVENIPDPKASPNDETQLVQDIISNWTEREQFLINHLLAGRTGDEIAKLEFEKYPKPRAVSKVTVGKWIAKLKDRLKMELAQVGVTESVIH